MFFRKFFNILQECQPTPTSSWKDICSKEVRAHSKFGTGLNKFRKSFFAEYISFVVFCLDDGLLSETVSFYILIAIERLTPTINRRRPTMDIQSWNRIWGFVLFAQRRTTIGVTLSSLSHLRSELDKFLRSLSKTMLLIKIFFQNPHASSGFRIIMQRLDKSSSTEHRISFARFVRSKNVFFLFLEKFSDGLFFCHDYLFEFSSSFCLSSTP